ncbi:hypothetical protein [Ciceribacter selenitireducens]
MWRLVVLALYLGLPTIAWAEQKFSVLEDCGSPVSTVDEFFSSVTDEKAVKKWNFNAVNVSLAYGLFAAASADSYASDTSSYLYLPEETLRRVNLNRLHGIKNGSSRFDGKLTGLSFDAYYREARDCVFVIVSIRGTENSVRDWYSNLSWITNVLLLPNQYREIDEQFAALRKYAEAKFFPRKITYIATGHSLGGGLANHLAKCFDDVSAVTFNSSFVHNSFYCRPRATTIVEIYDREEILSYARHLAGASQSKHVNTLHFATYGINPYEEKKNKRIKQHSMEGMALAMLRAPIECEMKKKLNCGTSRKLARDNLKISRIILCENFNKRLIREQGKYDFADVCQ